MAEQQNESGSLNQEDGVSGSEGLCLNSVASADRADDPVEEENDPGNFDQQVENSSCRHRTIPKPAARPETAATPQTAETGGQARADFTAAELASGRDLYMYQRDNRSASDVIYRMRVREKAVSDANSSIDHHVRQQHSVLADYHVLTHDDIGSDMRPCANLRGSMNDSGRVDSRGVFLCWMK